MTDTSITELVEGPHEWGYRDLTDGSFIADDAPFNLVQAYADLSAERDKLRGALEPFKAMAEALSDWPAGDDQPPFFRPVITRDVSGRRETRFVCLTIADLRRAVEALSESAK